MEKNMRRFFMATVTVVYFIFGAIASAQTVLALPEPQVGKDYAVLSQPVPTSDPKKIEVTEVFWYGCPHCYKLEPVVNKWAAEQDDDVHFVRLPAAQGKVWSIHGQLFLTLESLKVENKLHDYIFDAIQNKRMPLLRPEDMAKFVEGFGINPQKFLETYNSFGVHAKLEQAKKLFNLYGITGVPVLIVNGKYRVEINENVTDPESLLRITNYLVQKEREALEQADSADTTPAANADVQTQETTEQASEPKANTDEVKQDTSDANTQNDSAETPN